MKIERRLGRFFPISFFSLSLSIYLSILPTCEPIAWNRERKVWDWNIYIQWIFSIHNMFEHDFQLLLSLVTCFGARPIIYYLSKS